MEVTKCKTTGSTIVFTIPVVIVPHAPAVPELKSSETSSTKELKKDLFFVEKHSINRELLKNRLHELEIQNRYTIFQTGVQALQEVERILREEESKDDMIKTETKAVRPI
jgi:hypothetical protein